MLKRLFPSRWARIVAWTGAAVAWGTSIVTVQAASQETDIASAEPVPTTEPEVQEVPEPLAAVPEAPEQGLVVIRYTPVPPPPPEVITRTVTVGGGGGGGGSTASSGGGGGSRPTINDVTVSSGS
jgi:hypothetical protein